MTTETKFTKGYWKIWGDWLICQDGTPENPIATFEPLGFNQQEGFANAHLIAAAPKMYMMLSRLQKECEMFYKEFGEPSSAEYEAVFVEVNELLEQARGDK